MSSHAPTAYPICVECGNDYACEGMDVCTECLETVCVWCGETQEHGQLDVAGRCEGCQGAT